MVNIWGYCELCDRWFECPMESMSAWACPSCAAQPLRIENRAMVVSHGAEGSGHG